MPKPYRWGDEAPPAVQRLKARRQMRAGKVQNVVVVAPMGVTRAHAFTRLFLHLGLVQPDTCRASTGRP